jgi:hypothetical protein
MHVETKLWCPVRDCRRNADYGKHPFPRARRDKAMDHIRKVHKSETERSLWPVWEQELKSVGRVT